jgi:Flp pilus assembly protein TadD
MQEKYDLAETFLEKVTTQDSENVIGWTLLALLYEQKGQELNAEITIKKTLKLNQSLLSESNNLNASTNQISNDIDLEASMIKKDEGF